MPRQAYLEHTGFGAEVPVLISDQCLWPPMIRRAVPSPAHVLKLTKETRRATFQTRVQKLNYWIHYWPQLALEVILQEDLEKKREARLARKQRNVAARARMRPARKARAKAKAASRPSSNAAARAPVAPRRRILKARKKPATTSSTVTPSVLQMLTATPA